MSTKTERQATSTWPTALVVGFVAGLVRPAAVALAAAAAVDVGRFELALQHELPLWWLVHVAYSVAYDVAATGTRLRTVAARPATGAVVGFGYGVALWAVNVVVLWSAVMAVLPILAADASVVGPLVGHVVYGTVLGVLYPLLRGRRA